MRAREISITIERTPGLEDVLRVAVELGLLSEKTSKKSNVSAEMRNVIRLASCDLQRNLTPDEILYIAEVISDESNEEIPDIIGSLVGGRMRLDRGTERFFLVIENGENK